MPYAIFGSSSWKGFDTQSSVLTNKNIINRLLIYYVYIRKGNKSVVTSFTIHYLIVKKNNSTYHVISQIVVFSIKSLFTFELLMFLSVFCKVIPAMVFLYDNVKHLFSHTRF